MSKSSQSQRDNFQIARPMSEAYSSKSSSHKFEQSDNNTQQKTFKQANDVQNYREERKQWESTGTNSRGGQPSAERVKDDSSRNIQPTSARGDSAGQSENGKDASYKNTQKSADRNEMAIQSDRVQSTTPRGAQSSTDHAADYSGRSERVRVPDSPVSDRYSSSASGDYQPSTPSEERRGGQDDGRDSRRDDGGQRGGGRSRDNH